MVDSWVGWKPGLGACRRVWQEDAVISTVERIIWVTEWVVLVLR